MVAADIETGEIWKGSETEKSNCPGDVCIMEIYLRDSSRSVAANASPFTEVSQVGEGPRIE